jgi:predicted exporter
VLIAQLREGPAARIILMAIEGADGPSRTRLSNELVRRLRGDHQFRVVLNGSTEALERDREFLVAHRYLLSERVDPQFFEVGPLRAGIADGIDLLASPLGLMAADLFARDPTGETLQVVEQVERSANHPLQLD